MVMCLIMSNSRLARAESHVHHVLNFSNTKAAILFVIIHGLRTSVLGLAEFCTGVGANRHSQCARMSHKEGSNYVNASSYLKCLHYVANC